jgi:hypothetical protein
MAHDAAEEDDGGELSEVVHTAALGRGALAGGALEEEEEDALVAEKIRLLQEENARLRARSAAPAPAPPAPAQPAASLVASSVSYLIQAAKEREKAAYEATLAAIAQERAEAERAARGAVLAQVDSWVGGSQAFSRRDSGGAPAALAALRVSVSKPRALQEGGAAALARLEAQFPVHSRETRDPPGAAKLADQAALSSLTGAVDDLERALASSAAAVAGAVAGGDAASAVTRLGRRLLAAPPAVRMLALVLAAALFLGVCYVMAFIGGEDSESQALQQEGIVFARDAAAMEKHTMQALQAAGEEGRAEAEKLQLRQAQAAAAGRRIMAWLAA